MQQIQVVFIKVTSDGKPIYEEREWQDMPTVTEQRFLTRVKEIEQRQMEVGDMMLVRLPEDLFNSPYQNTTAQHLRGMTARQAGALAMSIVNKVGWKHTERSYVAALNNYLTD